MAIALVTHWTDHSTNGNTYTTSSGDTTGANLLVLHVTWFTNAITVSDSKSNTWTSAVLTDSGQNIRSEIWYAKNPTVGTGHTFTITGASSSSCVMILAFSGADTTAPLDQTSWANQGGGTSLQTGSVTPGQNNELLVTGCSGQTDNTGTVSVDSGFTLTDQQPLLGGQCFQGAAAYLIQTTATAKNPTWTASTGTGMDAASIATFKAAAGAAFVAGTAMVAGQGSVPDAISGTANAPMVTQAVRRSTYY